MDNSTAHPASEYGREVERTIPFHAELLDQAVDAALAVSPSPRRWLDTGCGPGRLGELVAARSAVELTFADPSAAMLGLARAAHRAVPAERFLQVPSQDLPPALAGSFDVVTAIQCHHYGDEATRARAVARCFDMLVPGGVFVVFENVRPETDLWHAIARGRTARWQRARGRDEAGVQEYLAREGTKFFPIRVSEHLALLARTGFPVVEILWRAYSQAGFVCLKARPA